MAYRSVNILNILSISSAKKIVVRIRINEIKLQLVITTCG